MMDFFVSVLFQEGRGSAAAASFFFSCSLLEQPARSKASKSSALIDSPLLPHLSSYLFSSRFFLLSFYLLSSPACSMDLLQRHIEQWSRNNMADTTRFHSGYRELREQPLSYMS